jgi:hypothetical protein
MPMNRRETYIDILVLIVIEVFIMTYLDVRYLFYDTVATGGDMASWQGVAEHLRSVLLPAGRLTGWDMGNFCGYPNFSFYFIPPFLVAAFLNLVFQVPLTIALKIVMTGGIFLLPVAAYLGARALGYRFPTPASIAGASVLFLFNESYAIFGGNILSTLAGEFCYMLAFCLFALFLGTLHRGLATGRNVIKNGILFGLIGLTHLFVFIPAVILIVYDFLARKRTVYLVKVSLIAFGLMAFWILPLVAYRHPYTTPVYNIWQEFVNWRYAMAGIAGILLLVGPGVAMAAMTRSESGGIVAAMWKLGVVVSSTILVLALSYVAGKYLLYGKDMWVTGLNVPRPAMSPLGAGGAGLIRPIIGPFSLLLSIVTAGVGMALCFRERSFRPYCRLIGKSMFLLGLALGFAALYRLICGTIENVYLRYYLLKIPVTLAVAAAVFTAAGWGLFFSKRFRKFEATWNPPATDRFPMLMGLSFGCVVVYFSGHFLQVPDIRFLPPLLFALMIIFIGEVIGPFFAETSRRGKVYFAIGILYLCILTVIFGSRLSGPWFRNATRGYEYQPGYSAFMAVNDYLRKAYSKEASGPLAAPRVGYEKCDLYGAYGGDRVFESLPYFAGRQTMEGIHFASSVASRATAFFQAEYSREIKTPNKVILSRIAPDRLSRHLDLYNVSQLILATETAKKAFGASPHFKKEAEFGPLSIFRYPACDGRYVDVPEMRPVLWKGAAWVEDFYRWYKTPEALDVLMVPDGYVRDSEDRSAFGPMVDRLEDLEKTGKERIDRTGLKISTEIDHLRIRFTTNRVGLPHLIKVSYFPNWRVVGARGAYPVSPHLMMVIPRQKEVILTYGHSRWEVLGGALTGATLVFLLCIPLFRRLGTGGGTRGPLERIGVFLEEAVLARLCKILDAARPAVLILVLAGAVGVIVGGAVFRNRPARIYIAGYRDFFSGQELIGKGQGDKARPFFERAVREMLPIVKRRAHIDDVDVINCMLTTAMSLENLEQYKGAERLYREIITEYPYSRYIGEAYVKIGRIRLLGRDRLLEDGMALLRKGDAAGVYAVLESLERTRAGLHHFDLARELDPYSVWAGYAKDDIEGAKGYIRSRRDTILAETDAAAVVSILDELLSHE